MIPLAHSLKAPGHPYGRILTNSQRTLNYMRISKCASSTAVHRFGLSEEARQQDINRSPVYAAIREPARRIVSSLLETLKRATIDKDVYYGSVVVPEAIYERILDFHKSDNEKLALQMLDLIQEIGPFDAHHEAMWKFLFDFSGQPYSNARLFTVEKMDLVGLHFALQGKVKFDFGRRRNSRRGVLRPFRNAESKYICYPDNHPIMVRGQSSGSIGWRKTSEILREMYIDIRSSKAVSERANAFVSECLSRDKILYSEVERRQSVAMPFTNLSELKLV